MEPITAIVIAIASGASEAVSPTANQVVKDLYSRVKKLIKDKYHHAHSSLEALEKKPESASKRESLREYLQDSGAENDVELLQQAQALLKAIEEHAPQVAQAIGIKLEDIKATNVRLQEIIVGGEQTVGVHIKHSESSGNIEIGKIKALMPGAVVGAANYWMSGLRNISTAGGSYCEGNSSNLCRTNLWC